ncbi:hypothetical protein SO802_008731 [Lithocarpus litseifolius]|uniref:Reverse transcriptase domain-containing protein n=1 Tax=Lithocarpus litseifolius TaxID=425828 RepID=A0AAW2DAH3_9ROSI
MDKEEGNGIEAVRTTQTCIFHEAGSSDKLRRSTLDAQEDAYGPWVVVTHRKQGTKISRASGGSTPLDLSVAGSGPKAKSQTYLVIKQGPLKAKMNLASKGKNVTGRNRVYKDSSKKTSTKATPSSSPKIQGAITHGVDKLEQRTPVEFQLTTGSWQEVGYIFGGHVGEAVGSGKHGNLGKWVQRQVEKGVEVSFSTNEGRSEHDVLSCVTLVRRKKNQILAIKNSVGEWIQEEKEIADLIRKGFGVIYTSLLTASSRVMPAISQWQGRLNEEEKESIGGQTAFVPGRKGIDNAIIVQELIHSISKKKGKVGYMAIKLDLEKAYDKLEWAFIRNMFLRINLPDNLIDLIMSCVTSDSTSILVNGAPLKPILPSREIRQGDPLSPNLFILCIEYLGQLIEDKCSNKLWNPVKASQSGLAFSHLLFVDDLVLFSRADHLNCSTIREVLDVFCEALGQTVSEVKSKVYFSPNVDEGTREELSDVLEFTSTQGLRKYLGRAALIQASSSTIPSYVMQCSYLPMRILEGMDRVNRNFLWSTSESTRKARHGVLRSLVTGPLSREDSNVKIRDIFKDNMWDWRCLDFDLSQNVKLMIQATPLALAAVGEDRLAWQATNTHSAGKPPSSVIFLFAIWDIWKS